MREGGDEDVSGERLNGKCVTRARAEEMQEVVRHGVYRKVPIRRVLAKTRKKPIGARRVLHK